MTKQKFINSIQNLFAKVTIAIKRWFSNLFFYLNFFYIRINFDCSTKIKFSMCSKKSTLPLVLFIKKFMNYSQSFILYFNRINFYLKLKSASAYTGIILWMVHASPKKIDTHEKVDAFFDNLTKQQVILITRGLSQAMRFSWRLKKRKPELEGPQPLQKTYSLIKEKVKSISLIKDISGKSYATFEDAFFSMNKEFNRQYCHFIIKSKLTVDEFADLTKVDEEIIPNFRSAYLRNKYYLISDKIIASFKAVQEEILAYACKDLEKATRLAKCMKSAYKKWDISEVVEAAVEMRKKMIMISDAKNEKLLANEYKYLLQTERTDWSIYFKNIWENSYYKPWKFITELHDIQVINDYKIFIIFVFSAIILSIIVTNVSRFIINSIINFDRSKVSVYECGFQPFEQLDKSQLFIFYRLSIIFIIFEAELIFIYPWILRIANQTTFFNAINYYYNPMLFIIIIIYGFYYEIKHRALDI